MPEHRCELAKKGLCPFKSRLEDRIIDKIKMLLYRQNHMVHLVQIMVKNEIKGNWENARRA